MEKRGLFGFLKGITKSAESTQTVEPVPFDFDQDVVTFVQDKLHEILSLAGFDGDVDIQKAQGNTLVIAINNSSDAGRVIGKDGANLMALQTLLKAMIHQKFQVAVKLILDSDGYRQRRLESLKAQAERAAEAIRSESKKRVTLYPMTAAERREVHMMFENESDINTFSEGHGERRRIILVRAKTK